MNILPTDKKFSLVETLFSSSDDASGISFAEELRAAVDRPVDEPAAAEPDARDDAPRDTARADDRDHRPDHAHRDDRPADRDDDAPAHEARDDDAPVENADAAPVESEAETAEAPAAGGDTAPVAETAQADTGTATETQVAALSPDMDVHVIAAALTAVTADNPATRIAPVAATAAAVAQAAVVADDVVRPTGPGVLGMGGQNGAAQNAGEAQAASQPQQNLTAAAQATASRTAGQNKPGDGKPGEMRVEVVTRSEPVVSRPTSTLTPNAAVAAEAVQNGNQQTGAGAGQNQTGGIPLNQNQAGLPQAGSPMDPAASFSQALRQARADIDGGGQAAERGNASGAEARPVAGASNTSATSGAQAAARTAPAAPPRPTPPLPVTEQVAVRITNAPLAGTERLQIQLRPAHLGRVEVQLDFNADGRVIATVTADRPETLSQLQRDAGALDRALQQAGLDTDSGSMNFNLRNGGQNSAGAGNDNGAGHGNALPGEETAEQGTELVQEGDQLALAGDDRGIDIRI